MARRTQPKSAGGKDLAGEAASSLGASALPAELEMVLGYRFTRPELLTLALTHRSFVYDAEAQGGAGTKAAANLADPSLDNEQLEFLGDAVLGLLAAEALCRRFPASREGELTRLRASVVSRRHLGQVGTELGLGGWLRLGRTAEQNHGRSNAALFANAVEALIAALFLDGGLEAARRFVEEKVLSGALPEMARSLAGGDKFSGAGGRFQVGAAGDAAGERGAQAAVPAVERDGAGPSAGVSRGGSSGWGRGYGAGGGGGFDQETGAAGGGQDCRSEVDRAGDAWVSLC